MIQEYPYAALYRALLAKKYKEEKHVDFQEALKKAALYSPNRKRLYHFININQKIKEVEKEEKVETAIEQSKIVQEDKAPLIVQEKIEENTKTVVDDIPEIKMELPQTDIVEVVTIDKNEANTSIGETIESIQEVSGEHSFVEWLEFLNDEVVFDSKEQEFHKAIERHEAAVIYEAELNEEVNKTMEEEEVVTPNLSAEESQKVNQLAEGSITLTTGLVTETLAKIMLMQGKINDAIAMYRALSLKYPEKSNYFAAQIEKIKNS